MHVTLNYSCKIDATSLEYSKNWLQLLWLIIQWLSPLITVGRPIAVDMKSILELGYLHHPGIPVAKAIWTDALVMTLQLLNYVRVSIERVTSG